MKSASARTTVKRMSVVFGFMRSNPANSGAALPPHREADERRNKRHQNKNQPAHIAECLFIETERESLRNFRRDPDELLSIHQPIDTAGDKIERLLSLPKRDVLHEERVAYHDHAGGIH